jgi:hypothetical protein
MQRGNKAVNEKVMDVLQGRKWIIQEMIYGYVSIQFTESKILRKVWK